MVSHLKAKSYACVTKWRNAMGSLLRRDDNRVNKKKQLQIKFAAAFILNDIKKYLICSSTFYDENITRKTGRLSSRL